MSSALSFPFLSIVVPAHNEENRLSEMIGKVGHFLADQTYTSEVVLVENGSTDRTLEFARSYEGHVPGLRVVHEDLSGKGRAVRRGMLDAKGEYRIFCDVDFSMPVTEVNRFIPPELPGAEIAIASREGPGAVRYGEPFYRHLAGRAFNTLVRWIALPGLQDTQCGFKCFRGDIAERIFNRQTMMGWSFDVEVLFMAQCWGYRIAEIPIPWYYSPQSRVRLLGDSWNMFRDMLTIRSNARHGLYDRPV